MKRSYLMISMIAAIALSACRGSGSGNENQVVDHPAEKPAPTQQQKPNHPTVEQKPAAKPQEKPASKPENALPKENAVFLSGHTKVEHLETQRIAGENSLKASNGDILYPTKEEVTGDEKKFTIGKTANTSSVGFTKEKYSHSYTMKNLSYSSFGNAIKSDYSGEKRIITQRSYSLGEVTTNPAALRGQATYYGNAFFDGNPKNDTIAQLWTKFKADVNFDEKKLHGSFSDVRLYSAELGGPDKFAQKLTGKLADLGSGEFNAEIKGNRFDGTGRDTVVSGYFYGPNAEEIGGVISTEKYEGAFGGTKK